MATVGLDCHITLQHADINAGVAYGFILDGDPGGNGPAPSIQREAYDNGDGTFTEKTRHFATILLANDLRNPDGSQHAQTKSATYAMLLLFLQKRSDIQLTTPVGVFGSLYCQGHIATETHYASVSLAAIQLASSGAVFEPADPVLYAQTAWLEDTDIDGGEWSEDGSETNTGYWTEG